MKLLNLLSTSFMPIVLPGFTGLSSLERLVINQAIKTSVFSTITTEWSFNNILFDIFNSHSNNMWIISVLGIYSYGYYKAYSNNDKKLKNINIYESWNKNIRELLFIIFIIFTKDVQSVL